MRKAVAFLTASLGLAWVVAANAQTAPDTFKDVPSDHWAYQAVDALRAKGILIGYPDGLYRGKRTMTRYEFAVALKRALDSIGTIKGEKGDPGAPGAPGATGPQGPQGEKGDSGVSPDDLAALRKLADEFKAELAKVGVDVNAANARIDKLAKDVASVKAALAAQPKVFGEAFMGVRADRASTFYFDQNGRIASALDQHGYKSLVNEALVTHDLKLGVQAKVGEGTTLTSAIVFGNYASAYNGMLGGNDYYPLNTKPTGSNYVDQLEINAPFTGVGRDGGLTLGRFGYAISPLTLCRPSVDVYFNNPIVDDNQFRMDGFKVTTNLGSLGTTVFAGKTDTIQDASGYPMMQPVVGLGSSIFGAGKPTAMSFSDALLVNQVGGISMTLPTSRVLPGGQVRVTGLLGTGEAIDSPVTNVAVLGADGSVPVGSFNVDAAWAKSLTGEGRFKTTNAYYNQAFTGNVSTKLMGIGLKAGYRFVDPLFDAPGYWGRIGNWINPTNIAGPTASATYEFSPSLSFKGSAEYLHAARDRAGEGSLGHSDKVNHLSGGLAWKVSPSFTLTGDYEGVFYKIKGYHSELGLPTGYTGTSHPTEEYVTLGTAYKVGGATLLKLGYQIGTVDYKIFADKSNYTYNTFFSQVAVKF